MKITRNAFKEASIKTICLLYIFLFVYASMSKILEFDNFQVQLGQSPLLSAFAGSLSYLVLFCELTIVVLLSLKRFRFVGLYASFTLMVMFSSYIFIMLTYSPFVPCSCGGILEKMSWDEHLWFNIVFVLLALCAILLERQNKTRPRFLLLSLVLTFVLGVGFITGLYLISEDTIHHRNNFIRRFPHHPAMLKKELDLGFNSYYIAGFSDGIIYLGNATTPLKVTAIDTTLSSVKEYRISLPPQPLRGRSLRIAVQPPYFYVTDGTIPFVLQGKISDWKAKVWMKDKAYFTAFEPMGGTQAGILTLSATSHENVLGTLNGGPETNVMLSDSVLNKQVDGIFDTDGILLYNKRLESLIYTYYYRNQYLVISSGLRLKSTGKTIDTVSRAQVKLRYVRSLNEQKLAAPAYLVNKGAATDGDYLFINAGGMGRYEPEEMWKVAAIIDVYDLKNQSYRFSFYITDRGTSRLTQFRVVHDKLIALQGNHLVVYDLTFPKA